MWKCLSPLHHLNGPVREMWVLSHRQTALANTSLPTTAVLPQPSLLAHTRYMGESSKFPKSRTF